jgi:3-hydroxyisobutyrate dehydrogenase-like beta-hydroxyacid dehydrogenase
MGLKLAIIGFGEVGQLFARQFAAKPGVDVAVYDILINNPVVAPEMRKVAAESRVRVAASLGEVCRGADVVVSVVTADAAVGAAREAASFLDRSQIYIDLNSVSPTTKRLVSLEIDRSGAAFVEFAVMSAVAGIGIAAPILAGGSKAAEVAARLNALGMAITPVSEDIGVASATKLCRSIVVKGMEALMVDLNLAAGNAGVLPAVLASLDVSYPGMDWGEIARTMPTRVERHGVRRAAEMREASRMMQEMGLSGSLAEAIAERHESFAKRPKA